MMNPFEARDVFQHLFLAKLYAVVKKRHIVFKGGTLLRQCVFPGYRFSEDLDFDIPDRPDRKIERLLRRVAEEVSVTAGELFGGRAKISRIHGNYFLEWAIEGMEGAIMLDFDSAKNMPELDLVDDWELVRNPHIDIGSPKILGYSVPQVLAMKFNCVSRRVKGRDLYDIWQILLLRNRDFLRGCEIYEGIWKLLPGSLSPRRVLTSLKIYSHIFETRWEMDKKAGFIPTDADMHTALAQISESLDF